MKPNFIIAICCIIALYSSTDNYFNYSSLNQTEKLQHSDSTASILFNSLLFDTEEYRETRKRNRAAHIEKMREERAELIRNNFNQTQSNFIADSYKKNPLINQDFILNSEQTQKALSLSKPLRLQDRVTED